MASQRCVRGCTRFGIVTADPHARIPTSRSSANEAVSTAIRSASVREKFAQARKELSATLIERMKKWNLVLTALLANEHVLLVGPPGCGKSLLLDAVMKLDERPQVLDPAHQFNLCRRGDGASQPHRAEGRPLSPRHHRTVARSRGVFSSTRSGKPAVRF